MFRTSLTTLVHGVVLSACVGGSAPDKAIDTDGEPTNPDCVVSGPEVCDGVDNNCDGIADAGCQPDTGGVAVETAADTGDHTDAAVDTDPPVFTGVCEGVNTTGVGDDLSSMGGPALLIGFAYTPPVDLQLGHIEVWTGEEVGVNTVAIWTGDVALNQPAAPLASGSWSMVSSNGWQGADLDHCVPLTAGVTYWVVWAPIEHAQSSFQASGTPVTYRGSFDGGQTWNGPWLGFPMFDLSCCG
jgi:hypothetical protein